MVNYLKRIILLSFCFIFMFILGGCREKENDLVLETKPYVTLAPDVGVDLSKDEVEDLGDDYEYSEYFVTEASIFCVQEEVTGVVGGTYEVLFEVLEGEDLIDPVKYIVSEDENVVQVVDGKLRFVGVGEGYVTLCVEDTRLAEDLTKTIKVVSSNAKEGNLISNVSNDSALLRYKDFIYFARQDGLYIMEDITKPENSKCIFEYDYTTRGDRLRSLNLYKDEYIICSTVRDIYKISLDGSVVEVIAKTNGVKNLFVYGDLIYYIPVNNVGTNNSIYAINIYGEEVYSYSNFSTIYDFVFYEGKVYFSGKISGIDSFGDKSEVEALMCLDVFLENPEFVSFGRYINIQIVDDMLYYVNDGGYLLESIEDGRYKKTDCDKGIYRKNLIVNNYDDILLTKGEFLNFSILDDVLYYVKGDKIDSYALTCKEIGSVTNKGSSDYSYTIPKVLSSFTGIYQDKDCIYCEYDLKKDRPNDNGRTYLYEFKNENIIEFY